MSSRSISTNSEVAALQATVIAMQGSINDFKIEVRNSLLEVKTTMKETIESLDQHYTPISDHRSLRNEFEAFKRQYILTHIITAIAVGIAEYITLAALGKIH